LEGEGAGEGEGEGGGGGEAPGNYGRAVGGGGESALAPAAVKFRSRLDFSRAPPRIGAGSSPVRLTLSSGERGEPGGGERERERERERGSSLPAPAGKQPAATRRCTPHPSSGMRAALFRVRVT